MRFAICIDLDGTLIPGTSVSLWLAECLGDLGEINALELKYLAGNITNKEIAERSARKFAGHSVIGIEELLSRLTLLGGISETVSALRARGCVLLLTTVTWSFAARYFAARLGFDAYCGTGMAEEDGVLTGTLSAPFDEYDKLEFVVRQCQQEGIAAHCCLAMGDSRSDVPLFGYAGFSIAVNGTDAARAAARATISTQDLRDTLPILMNYMDTAT